MSVMEILQQRSSRALLLTYFVLGEYGAIGLTQVVRFDVNRIASCLLVTNCAQKSPSTSLFPIMWPIARVLIIALQQFQNAEANE